MTLSVALVGRLGAVKDPFWPIGNGSPVQMGCTVPLWLSLSCPTAAKFVVMPAARLVGPATKRLVRKEKRLVLASPLAGTGPSLKGNQSFRGTLEKNFVSSINVQFVP